jgi:hypothetical protein
MYQRIQSAHRMLRRKFIRESLLPTFFYALVKSFA